MSEFGYDKPKVEVTEEMVVAASRIIWGRGADTDYKHVLEMTTDALRAALKTLPDELDNHHNAAVCPYCSPIETVRAIYIGSDGMKDCRTGTVVCINGQRSEWFVRTLAYHGAGWLYRGVGKMWSDEYVHNLGSVRLEWTPDA